MIEKGNYDFFDYEQHKDKFLDIFTQIYGEEHRDEISRRLDTVQYIPYIEPKVVYEYYNQLINMHSDELIHEFKKLMGLRRVPQEMAELIWSEKDLDSPLVFSIVFGENLEQMKEFASYEDDIEDALAIREKAYKIFGLEGEDKFERLQDIARKVNDAMTIVGNRYPCDVVKDIKRYQENKVTALQMFFTKLSKIGYPFTEKDRAILAKPDIDFVDITGMDSNIILFNRNIGNPGLMYYFTTENQNLLINGASPEEVEQILKGRLQYWALNLPNGTADFQFVSGEEIMGGETPRDIMDFIRRMEREVNLIAKNYPEYNTSCEEADNVESYRKAYADGIYSGCKFVKNINRDYQNIIHDPFKNEWCTYMDNEYDMFGKPLNHIFFNESGNMTPNALLHSMIHELGHVIRRSNPTLDEKNHMSIERCGIHTTAKQVVNGMVGGYLIWDDQIMQAEENINERITNEAEKLFLDKYGCVYQDSDIPYLEQREMACYYDYWNFILEDFYNHFRDAILEHPLNLDFDMYYKYQNPPTTNKEAITNMIAEKVRRKLTPNAFSETGCVDRMKVQRLGELIAYFQTQIIPELTKHDVNIEEFNNREGDTWRTLPLEVKDDIARLEAEVEDVFESMLADERALEEYRRELNDGDLTSGLIPALKNNARTAIINMLERRDARKAERQAKKEERKKKPWERESKPKEVEIELDAETLQQLIDGGQLILNEDGSYQVVEGSSPEESVSEGM